MIFYRFLLIMLVAGFVPLASAAQYDTTAIKQSVREFQDELNAEYRDIKTSPLEPGKVKKFKGHDFFPVNTAYTVQATLTITHAAQFFKMKTSSGREKDYRQYGLLTFTLLGKEYKLPVYQSQQLMNTEEYADYLFLPFTDLTNGEETYAAGRYIDLRMPADNDIVLIDFNKAYNPLCAYSDRYSCPVVPAENHLDIKIPAGVKYYKP